ncbi:serine hydrolase [Pleionea sp. CnH1-48]|uniref:serine hydrolase n=1 Tax=Pleionea sp. CnH1-48 TaxID=2954494 RepID=UPI00209761E6|nr:serine hydrolase [Pleionea sp. CnH1-48]MCO7224392.1 serine hydrolase [Pleionea sp. CnH1-48]
MSALNLRTKLTYLLSIFLLLVTGASVANTNKETTSRTISNKALLAKTEEIVKQYVEPGWFSGSLMIMKDNQVIYEKSYGLADIEKDIKNSSTTKVRIGSINKHFTATLVMQKVQSGKLSLDDQLETFELGFPKEIASKITVRHLLNHTSGFADIFNEEYIKTYRSLKDINDKMPLLIDKPLISEPGEQYNYSNYGYIVLGAILEKLENKSFSSIINENIFNVIKLKDTRYALTEEVKNKARSYHFGATGEKVDRTDILENLTPDGGMYSTPRDIAHFYSSLFFTDKLLNDESKAVIGNGYKHSARKWNEILNSEKTHWNSYGGGPGVSAAAEILMKDKLIVVALANTDGLVAEYITQRIVDEYKGKPHKKVKLPLGLFAMTLLKEKGGDYLIKNAKQEFAKAGYSNYRARPLNKLGFALIKNNQLDKAISVFATNTKLFPDDANAFDSLAHAYEQAGNNTKALVNYKKALSLDANFQSAKDAIFRLSQ